MSVHGLVILGNTVTALAVARDAHAHGLLPVIGDTTPGLAGRSRYVRVTLFEGPDEEQWVEQLVRLANERPTALIATGDRWLRFIARARATLESVFADILHPANDALHVCLSKACFAGWCEERGLPSPKAWVGRAGERPYGLAFPLLIRPDETLHGRADVALPKAVEVCSDGELDHWLGRYAEAGIAPLVTESLLDHPLIQYSVPVARRDGNISAFVARKVRPLPKSCAGGTYVELSPEPLAEELARRAIEGIDFYGIGEVEVLHSLDTDEYSLIEVNARPWAQYALAPASGHDFLGFVLGMSSEAGSERKSGLGWMDLRSDLYVCFSRSEGLVRRGEVGLGQYLATVARTRVHATFSLLDPWPTIAGAA